MPRLFLFLIGWLLVGASSVATAAPSRLASAIIEVDALGKVVAVTPVNDPSMVKTIDTTPKAAEKK